MVFGLFEEDNVKFVIDYINSIVEYTKNGKLKDSPIWYKIRY